MRDKTKTVEAFGSKYQLARFSPEIGTFILFRLIGAMAKVAQSSNQAGTNGEAKSDVKPTPEQMARLVASGAMMSGGLEFEIHKMIQQNCLKLCSRADHVDQGSGPVPIMTADGRLLPDVAENVGLLTKLTLEVLVFNLSDFFGQGGMETIT